MFDTILDANHIHPVPLPDGTYHEGVVFLKNVIDHPRFSVGDFTYASDFDPPELSGWAARLAPYLFPFSQDHLCIGKYCQIAHGVRFLGGSANHEMRAVTSFPFAVFDPEGREGYQPDTRGIDVGHDVWIGQDARILAGARIGNGVFVGAGAVVRGDVPDYAVVLGNPARVVRMRFPEAEIATLNRLAWWDWPPARVSRARGLLEAGDVAALSALGPD